MRKHNEQRFVYGFYRTPWGSGLAAASGGMIERIYIPDDPGLLVSRLEDELGPASPAQQHAVLEGTLRQLEGYFTGKTAVFDVPLNLEGLTPFQARVVDAARRIPLGSVRTYGWLAAEAGSPAASRACGQVMAANRFPVVVPCHRVVASGGKLGGYSGGLVWKERLLELEGEDVTRAALLL